MTRVVRQDGGEVSMPSLLPSAFFVMEPSHDKKNMIGYNIIGTEIQIWEEDKRIGLKMKQNMQDLTEGPLGKKILIFSEKTMNLQLPVGLSRSALFPLRLSAQNRRQIMSFQI